MGQFFAQGLLVLTALGGAYLIAFWFVLIVWTYRDIESRSRSVVTQVFSTLLSVLFFVPGVLLYLILRPKETIDEAFQRSLEEEYLLQDLEELPLCTTCHRYVEDDFLLCPHCHAQLREPCPTCSRLVDLRWSLCPYCAAARQGDATKRIEAPAARWTAPALRRRRPSVERVRIVATADRDLALRETAESATASNGAKNGQRSSDHLVDGQTARLASEPSLELVRRSGGPVGDRTGATGKASTNGTVRDVIARGRFQRVGAIRSERAGATEGSRLANGNGVNGHGQRSMETTRTVASLPEAEPFSDWATAAESDERERRLLEVGRNAD